jgi:large conductance mechanosensitive channel protein
VRECVESEQEESTLSDFKTFVLRGNVVDLAVAVVVGVAFTAVIAAFAAVFLTPLIGAIFRKSSFQNLYFTLHHSKFMYGGFLNKVLSFLIVAKVVLFGVVVPPTAPMRRLNLVPKDESKLETRLRGAARSPSRAGGRPRSRPPRRPHRR